jgi:hypothetical protein
MMESLMVPSKVGYGFVIGANTSEGWLAVGNGNQGGGKIVAAAAVVPVAVIAATALPAIAKAKAAAQRHAQQMPPAN